jgi:putative phosphoesterase
MYKIAVMTDIHANLPALEAALKAIQAEGYDALIQTGDVISIGPYPFECLELMLNTPKVENIKGNHEVFFVDGISDSQLENMGPGEVQHYDWTHACLTEKHKSLVANWPFLIKHEIEGVRVAFMHSGLGESGHDIQGIPKDASGADLDPLYQSYGADLVFYGHRHEDSDVQGLARYVNPGSLGCNPIAVARYCMVEFNHGRYQIDHRLAPYDNAGLLKAFEERQVPDRNFICQKFFGGRF